MFIRRAAAAALFIALSTSPANAGTSFDVTGTWQGTMSCRFLSLAGESLKGVIPVSVAMVQTDGLVAAEMTQTGVASGAVAMPRGVVEGSPLCGLAAGNAAKPGSGLLNFSAASALVLIGKGGLNSFPAEMGLAVKLSEPNAKGLSGKASGGVIMDSFISGAFFGIPVLGSCSFKMTRTSNDVPTIDPDLPAICAEVYGFFAPTP